MVRLERSAVGVSNENLDSTDIITDVCSSILNGSNQSFGTLTLTLRSEVVPTVPGDSPDLQEIKRSHAAPDQEVPDLASSLAARAEQHEVCPRLLTQ
jgi:hypothetical protein